MLIGIEFRRPVDVGEGVFELDAGIYGHCCCRRQFHMPLLVGLGNGALYRFGAVQGYKQVHCKIMIENL